MIEYYTVLGLQRNASINEIKQAYRIHALKFNPERNSSPEARDTFNQVSEAFDVLSNSTRRAVYDKFGVTGLQDGIPNVEGCTQGYKFHGNSQQIFKKFFGSENPFAELILNAKVEKPYGEKFGGLQGMNVAEATNYYPARPEAAPQVPQEVPLEVAVPCTLEDLYNGAIKRIPVTRRRLNDDGVTTREDTKLFTLHINKGYRSNMKLVFEREGNEGSNRTSGDLVFVVNELPHPTFTRKGDDLHFQATIPLITGLTGSIVELTMLDDRKFKVPINDIIHPSYQKEIPDEGMPMAQNPKQRGRLILSFNLQFPTYISAEQKLALANAFSS